MLGLTKNATYQQTQEERIALREYESGDWDGFKIQDAIGIVSLVYMYVYIYIYVIRVYFSGITDPEKGCL